MPDECDPDSDGDGTPDACEISSSYCGPAIPNSSGAGALIDAFGSDQVADNDVTLLATQLPVNQFGYFLTSTTQAFVPQPGGSQGNLCLGGQIGRYSQQLGNSGAAGELSLTLDLTDMAGSAYDQVQPGETFNFQTWFRDKNPQQTSNFTDAISITFQ